MEFSILVCWMIWDARFEPAANRLLFAVGLLGESQGTFGDATTIGTRVLLLAAAITFVVLTHLLMFITLLWGSRKHRSLRAWFAFVTLVCLWTTTGMSWRDVTWWGKQQRLRSHVGEFESFAHELRTHWPQTDGRLASSDPYMAYPVGRPATLIMLTLPEVSREGTSFSVVDRSTSGSLRFQLTGREAGDWLEWHPTNEEPASFVGGLLDSYELERFWNLGEGWCLVRYRR